MDIQRKKSGVRSRRFRTAAYAVLGVCAIAAVTLVVARLKPAAPTVERGTLLIDTVKRGQMLRQVRGPGTLVPEEVRVVAAATEGRVERILVQPGTEVTAGTVLLELVNPTLAQEALDAEYARANRRGNDGLDMRRKSFARRTRAGSGAAIRPRQRDVR